MARARPGAQALRRAPAALAGALAAAFASVVGGRLEAQGAPRPAPLAAEGRVDAVVARHAGVLAGAGVFADAGLYARLGLVAGAGVVRARSDRGSGAVGAARVEALGRFHLDPLRQGARGVYAGGGVAAAWREGARPAWELVALLGVEGAPRRGVAPALEVGFGGGARVALVLRRARAGRR